MLARRTRGITPARFVPHRHRIGRQFIARSPHEIGHDGEGSHPLHRHHRKAGRKSLQHNTFRPNRGEYTNAPTALARNRKHARQSTITVRARCGPAAQPAPNQRARWWHRALSCGTVGTVPAFADRSNGYHFHISRISVCAAAVDHHLQHRAAPCCPENTSTVNPRTGQRSSVTLPLPAAIYQHDRDCMIMPSHRVFP